jgi:hypothetical protein
MSSNEISNISYEDIYLDLNHYEDKMNQNLIEEKKLSCCDKICLWWFFHSSSGLNKESNESYKNCICCDLCSWCCEFKCERKCCLNECGFCCFTIKFAD